MTDNQTKSDGGPAFPQVPFECGSVVVKGSAGMTLRDYFAAKAMAAIIVASSYRKYDDGTDVLAVERFDLTLKWIPATAYALADAMLTAREARPC